MEMSIELDAPPGAVRPSELIPYVVKDTILALLTDPNEPTSMCFGNWKWDYSGKGITEEEWKKVQEITMPRVVALYNEGSIRYGSW